MLDTIFLRISRILLIWEISTFKKCKMSRIWKFNASKLVKMANFSLQESSKLISHKKFQVIDKSWDLHTKLLSHNFLIWIQILCQIKPIFFFLFFPFQVISHNFLFDYWKILKCSQCVNHFEGLSIFNFWLILALKNGKKSSKLKTKRLDFVLHKSLKLISRKIRFKEKLWKNVQICRVFQKFLPKKKKKKK